VAQLLHELAVSCPTRAPMISARAGGVVQTNASYWKPCHWAATHDRAVGDL